MKVNFSELRRKLDDALTYADFETAKRIAEEGRMHAEFEEQLGEIMYFKAQTLIINEYFEEAVRCLDQAIYYNPHDGAAYNDRALCRLELGAGEEEILADFDKGIEVEPDYATIYHNKGWFLNKIGQHSEAITYFELTLALEPKRAVTYENLADAYLHLGNIEEAVRSFQQALHYLNPRYTEIRRQLETKIEILKLSGM